MLGGVNYISTKEIVFLMISIFYTLLIFLLIIAFNENKKLVLSQLGQQCPLEVQHI